MNEKLYTLIEDYNLGRLAPAQLEAFEAAMKTDAALAAAVQVHRVEWEAQEMLAENVLRAQIRQTFVEHPPQTQHWLLKNWQWTALTLLFLGIAGVLFFQKTPTEALPQNAAPANLPTDTVPTRDTLVPPPNVPKAQPPQPLDTRKYAMAAYRVPDDLITTTRGEESEDTLSLVNKAFTEQNYRRVIQLLTTLPKDERQEALAIRAHAQFGAGLYADAARDFAELGKGGIYRREAQWFGVLAQMAAKGSDKKLWMKELDKIRQEEGHPYQKEADALWRGLEVRGERVRE